MDSGFSTQVLNSPNTPPGPVLWRKLSLVSFEDEDRIVREVRPTTSLKFKVFKGYIPMS